MAENNLERTDRKIDKYDALGIEFSNTEKSLIDFGETLWNLLGPSITGGGYGRAEFPIGENTSFTAERGTGLYGQFERPDMIREPEEDLKLTLSRYF
jgi:hypothetical protein|tara:strand:- start:99 stop:389 length:291 start_codon:yes stop_codon:yes gene_type:complete